MSLIDSILEEQQLLSNRSIANYIIDTTELKPKELKRKNQTSFRR